MSLEAKSKAKATAETGFWDLTKILVEAIVIAFLLRIFLYQPFTIPTGSMERTLLVGDFLFVSKLSYGYSRYSFPYGDFADIHRCAVLSAESRAGQYDHEDIKSAAGHLHGMLEGARAAT